MILDTCYFIDLQRKPSSVQAISARIAHRVLFATAITYGELAEGLESPSDTELGRITLGLPVLGIDESIAKNYGAVRRHLRSSGLLIGDNDLWIAAIALTHGLPIVTRNVSEFRRIDGLQVVAY